MSSYDIGILFGAIALLALGLTGLFAFYDLVYWIVQATKRRTRRRVR